MRHLGLLLLALALAAGPARAEDLCKVGTAALTGSYSAAYPGMGAYTYTQEMTLERHGPGLTGLWIGTMHRQTSHYPFALDAAAQTAVMAGFSQIPGVDATCVPGLPDASTIVVTCTGRYPFTVHGNGTITWQGKAQVLGRVSNGVMVIDMLAGTPGYAAQSIVDGSMNGTAFPAGQIDLTVEVSADGQLSPPPIPSWGFTAKATAAPAEGTEVTVIATATSKINGGPLVLAGPSDDTAKIALRGESAAVRQRQAEAVSLYIEAKRGSCYETRSIDLFRAMVLSGVSP